MYTASAEPTVDAGKFGFGASVAFAVPTHQVIAEVDDNGVINGAGHTFWTTLISVIGSSLFHASVSTTSASLSTRAVSPICASPDFRSDGSQLQSHDAPTGAPGR